MELRTEYNLTLSQNQGCAVVKALVSYHEVAEETGQLPKVFEVPGVLRIENITFIEGYTYNQVPNPAFVDHPQVEERPEPNRWFTPRYQPRRKAETELMVLNVKFVVWQMSVESVNT